MRGRTPSPPRVLGMQHCITQLLCQGLYVQGNKQFLLLWAALGDHPLRCPVGIDHQGLLDPPQPFGQEANPDGQMTVLESKHDDSDQKQREKAVEGMDQELTVRPVMCWPPQSRSPTLADAEQVFHFGLVPVGYDHALIAEFLAIRKEDGLAQVAVLDLSFFPHSIGFSGGAPILSPYACSFNALPSGYLICTDSSLHGDETWDTLPKRHAKTARSPSISTTKRPTASSLTTPRRLLSLSWPFSSRSVFSSITKPRVAPAVSPATPIMSVSGWVD